METTATTSPPLALLSAICSSLDQISISPQTTTPLHHPGFFPSENPAGNTRNNRSLKFERTTESRSLAFYFSAASLAELLAQKRLLEIRWFGMNE